MLHACAGIGKHMLIYVTMSGFQPGLVKPCKVVPQTMAQIALGVVERLALIAQNAESGTWIGLAA